jgi:hypothetical protein
MSILNPKPKNPPPRAPVPPQHPVPATRPQPPTNQLYEDAVRFGQGIVELQHTAARLQGEVDEWERRAKLAEEEVRRLEMRLDHQEHAAQERVASLEEQRDRWKIAYNDVEKSLQLAGGIILDVVEKSKTRRSLNINLNSLAEAVENPVPPEPPPQRIVDGGAPSFGELVDKLTKEKGPDRD